MSEGNDTLNTFNIKKGKNSISSYHGLLLLNFFVEGGGGGAKLFFLLNNYVCPDLWLIRP